MGDLLGATPSQTVGPYFTMVLGQTGQNIVAPPGTPGTRIRIEGRVFDGDRAPIEDALIDMWQANAAGRYRHPLDTRHDISLDPGFTGFGSAASEFQTGGYWFETVKPGEVPDGRGGHQAPHLNLVVQARGMLMPSFTRVYFADDEQAHQRDLVLSMVPQTRRHTLIAARTMSADHGEMPVYTFDIMFQGDDETVFFDL